MKKYKIPLGKTKLAVIYTKDIFDVKTMEQITNYFRSIDWDDKPKFLLLPSEYIEKIEFVKIKKRKLLAFMKWYLNKH